MFRGFYTAASGMLAQMRRQQVITNNIANLNTPGYKADEAVLRAFPRMLISRLGQNAPHGAELGTIATGVYVQETVPSFVSGDLKETGEKTDVALLPFNGEGMLFFAVEGERGPVYTRNGNFAVDAAGNLVDSDGRYVLGIDGEPIVVSDGTFTVAEDGTVVDDGNVVGQIQVAYAADPLQLTKVGNGLFTAEEPLPIAQEVAGAVVRMKQGFLERSNVNPEEAMTELLASYRAMEASQKVVKAYDHTMGLAVNEVGRVGRG